MLEAVRLYLRRTNNVFDDEITALIEAGKFDLRIAGVVNIDDNDPLILQAIKLYAKANFGDADDSDKYQNSYDMLKRQLCLSGDYNGVNVQLGKAAVSLSLLMAGELDV